MWLILDWVQYLVIALLLVVLYAIMIIPSSAYVLVVDRKDVHAMTWEGMGLWLLHSPVEAVFDIAIATDPSPP